MRFSLNAPVCRRIFPIRWLVLLAGFALLSSFLRAEVTYLGEINGSFGFEDGRLIAVSNAPFDPSDPLYDSSTTRPPWVVTSRVYYTIDPATGAVSSPGDFPSSVKLTTDSFVAFAGRNTSAQTAFVLGYRGSLYQLSLAGPSPVTVGPSQGVAIPLAQIFSMAAADRSHLTIIGDGEFHSINVDLTEEEPDIPYGKMTTYFALKGGTGPREFSVDGLLPDGENDFRGTRYHAYGPSGLAYVLDYGNDRMQLLDPQNDFAYVSEFSLNPSVTTANMQFAIGLNGNVYLGDGLGGGSAYDADGNFLGVFGLPDPMEPDESNAPPYILTDASGGVYVFDKTGNHRYQDLSAVPEPSISALAGLAALALAAWHRRHRREGMAQS